ncbi:hypothetical protein SNL152K_7253 [Streptomyces sp. NL15-2K]|nr:hypothetical protein SNL152K_7253 [Streptomyces sp. NL15-2K]
MARRTLSGALTLTAALVMTPTIAHASPPGTKDVTAVLFEWNFASVAKECTNVSPCKDRAEAPASGRGRAADRGP